MVKIAVYYNQSELSPKPHPHPFPSFGIVDKWKNHLSLLPCMEKRIYAPLQIKTVLQSIILRKFFTVKSQILQTTRAFYIDFFNNLLVLNFCIKNTNK